MLTSKNIHLRTLEPEDAFILLEWENNPENWKVSNTIVPFSEHLIMNYVNSAQEIEVAKQIRFVICKNETDEPIGTIDLFDYDAKNQKAGLGILIAKKEERNKGFANESLQIIINYCFNNLLIHNIYCNINESNTESIQLFKKNGFELIGTKKDWIRTKNGFENELMFQILS